MPRTYEEAKELAQEFEQVVEEKLSDSDLIYSTSTDMYASRRPNEAPAMKALKKLSEGNERLRLYINVESYNGKPINALPPKVMEQMDQFTESETVEDGFFINTLRIEYSVEYV